MKVMVTISDTPVYGQRQLAKVAQLPLVKLLSAYLIWLSGLSLNHPRLSQSLWMSVELNWPNKFCFGNSGEMQIHE